MSTFDTEAAPADAVIIGGCGRVGLPLGIALASRGLSVTLYDINAAAVATVNGGALPFAEEGAAVPLAAAVREGRLRATTASNACRSDNVRNPPSNSGQNWKQ